MEAWQNSWTEFVSSVAACWNNASSNKELSKQFSNKELHWTGVVNSLNHREEYAASVDFEMEKVVARLRSGVNLVVDSVSLHVLPNRLEFWDSVREGDKVSFSASISGTLPPSFNLIELVESTETAYLKIMLTETTGDREVIVNASGVDSRS